MPNKQLHIAIINLAKNKYACVINKVFKLFSIQFQFRCYILGRSYRNDYLYPENYDFLNYFFKNITIGTKCHPEIRTAEGYLIFCIDYDILPFNDSFCECLGYFFSPFILGVLKAKLPLKVKDYELFIIPSVVLANTTIYSYTNPVLPFKSIDFYCDFNNTWYKIGLNLNLNSSLYYDRFSIIDNTLTINLTILHESKNCSCTSTILYKEVKRFNFTILGLDHMKIMINYTKGIDNETLVCFIIPDSKFKSNLNFNCIIEIKGKEYIFIQQSKVVISPLATQSEKEIIKAMSLNFNINPYILTYMFIKSYTKIRCHCELTFDEYNVTYKTQEVYLRDSDPNVQVELYMKPEVYVMFKPNECLIRNQNSYNTYLKYVFKCKLADKIPNMCTPNKSWDDVNIDYIDIYLYSYCNFNKFTGKFFSILNYPVNCFCNVSSEVLWLDKSYQIGFDLMNLIRPEFYVRVLDDYVLCSFIYFTEKYRFSFKCIFEDKYYEIGLPNMTFNYSINHYTYYHMTNMTNILLLTYMLNEEDRTCQCVVNAVDRNVYPFHKKFIVPKKDKWHFNINQTKPPMNSAVNCTMSYPKYVVNWYCKYNEDFIEVNEMHKKLSFHGYWLYILKHIKTDNDIFIILDFMNIYNITCFCQIQLSDFPDAIKILYFQLPMQVNFSFGCRHWCSTNCSFNNLLKNTLSYSCDKVRSYDSLLRTLLIYDQFTTILEGALYLDLPLYKFYITDCKPLTIISYFFNTTVQLNNISVDLFLYSLNPRYKTFLNSSSVGKEIIFKHIGIPCELNTVQNTENIYVFYFIQNYSKINYFYVHSKKLYIMDFEFLYDQIYLFNCTVRFYLDDSPRLWCHFFNFGQQKIVGFTNYYISIERSHKKMTYLEDIDMLQFNITFGNPYIIKSTKFVINPFIISYDKIIRKISPFELSITILFIENFTGFFQIVYFFEPHNIFLPSLLFIYSMTFYGYRLGLKFNPPPNLKEYIFIVDTLLVNRMLQFDWIFLTSIGYISVKNMSGLALLPGKERNILMKMDAHPFQMNQLKLDYILESFSIHCKILAMTFDNYSHPEFLNETLEYDFKIKGIPIHINVLTSPLFMYMILSMIIFELFLKCIFLTISQNQVNDWVLHVFKQKLLEMIIHKTHTSSSMFPHYSEYQFDLKLSYNLVALAAFTILFDLDRSGILAQMKREHKISPFGNRFYIGKFTQSNKNEPPVYEEDEFPKFVFKDDVIENVTNKIGDKDSVFSSLLSEIESHLSHDMLKIAASRDDMDSRIKRFQPTYFELRNIKYDQFHNRNKIYALSYNLMPPKGDKKSSSSVSSKSKKNKKSSPTVSRKLGKRKYVPYTWFRSKIHKFWPKEKHKILVSIPQIEEIDKISEARSTHHRNELEFENKTPPPITSKKSFVSTMLQDDAKKVKDNTQQYLFRKTSLRTREQERATNRTYFESNLFKEKQNEADEKLLDEKLSNLSPQLESKEEKEENKINKKKTFFTSIFIKPKKPEVPKDLLEYTYQLPPEPEKKSFFNTNFFKKRKVEPDSQTKSNFKVTIPKKVDKQVSRDLSYFKTRQTVDIQLQPEILSKPKRLSKIKEEAKSANSSRTRSEKYHYSGIYIEKDILRPYSSIHIEKDSLRPHSSSQKLFYHDLDLYKQLVPSRQNTNEDEVTSKMLSYLTKYSSFSEMILF